MSGDSFLHWDAGLKILRITIHLIMHDISWDENLLSFSKFVKIAPFWIFSPPLSPFLQIKNHGFCKFPPFFLYAEFVFGLTFTICKLFSSPFLTIATYSTEQAKFWNLREAQNFVLLMIIVSLFSGPWLVFCFLSYAYPITFTFEFEMSLIFKTNIISFIDFISFWKKINK